ncbi:MAG: hypothetical protein IKU55_04325 [Clostridia bacterium]|nr:hypothetical protein [Clostridia bacterium]
MYKIGVPLVRYAEFHEENLAHLRRLGAERVFLCPGRGFGTAEEQAAEYARLAENVKFYTEAGYEVGVWCSTIGHGGELVGASDNGAAMHFTRLIGLKGRSNSDSFCPLDPDFSRTVCNHIANIARCGPKLIMVDDDYRLATRSDCGCTCERHMAEYQKRLGEPIAREDVLKKAFTGGKNRYRDTWLELMGDTLRGFARQMREAVDSVDPTIRLGACSCMSVWDQDGVDSIELAKIFAGSTKPFLRLIGAAYWPAFWAAPCDKLAYVAELERMQRHWCEMEDIEIFGEGDVYPRPRYVVPSANLELYDTILRADGGFDGNLKYGVDYFSSSAYEKGYSLRAERNRPLYAELARHFGEKRAVGVSVASTMKKIADKVFTDPEREIGANYDDGFFQPEQQVLTSCALPITYDDAPVKAVFGENARHLDLENLPSGLLLDAAAAKILEERGLDVGLASAKALDGSVGAFVFPTYDERTPMDSTNGLMAITPKSGATVLAEFAGSQTVPAVVRYENADGLRVILLAICAERSKTNARFLRNYCLPRLLASELGWAGRAELPVTCFGNPDLYVMAKRDETTLTVGLWNIFADEALAPELTLDRAYTKIETIRGEAEVIGNTVKFSTDIPAFGFAGFTVSL